MSYVSSGGMPSSATILKGVGNVVPGATLLGEYFETGIKSKLLMALGIWAVIGIILTVTLTRSGFSSDGIAWRGMGAAGTDTIKPSDPIFGYPRGANNKDTFLNHGVGPEFVEQPNYLLGQEDMLRHALTKWNNLKASGAAVSDWPTYWAAYKAENADDLSASMYDFGSDGFKGSAKELRSAGLGR